MGQDVKHPLRGAGLSSLCLQEKKGLLSTRSQRACVRVRACVSTTVSLVILVLPAGLVSAVSEAVEAILGQFSASRTVVQKVSQCWSCSTGEEARNSPLMILVLMFSSILVSRAFSLFSFAHSFYSLCPPLLCFQTLSGDSTINPALGRLVLQCLCPALHSLLTDGLKPHQSDLIAGRRPNSAWGLVQASTRPGSKKMSIYDLKINEVMERLALHVLLFRYPSIIFPNKGRRKQILIGYRFDCSSHLI